MPVPGRFRLLFAVWVTTRVSDEDSARPQGICKGAEEAEMTSDSFFKQWDISTEGVEQMNTLLYTSYMERIVSGLM
jgi:hypothetical protein